MCLCAAVCWGDHAQEEHNNEAPGFPFLERKNRKKQAVELLWVKVKWWIKSLYCCTALQGVGGHLFLSTIDNQKLKGFTTWCKPLVNLKEIIKISKMRKVEIWDEFLRNNEKKTYRIIKTKIYASPAQEVEYLTGWVSRTVSMVWATVHLLRSKD